MTIEDQLSDVDYFSEGDLAEPELFPEKKRILGRIGKVDLTQSEEGNFRKLGNSKDGRTEVPVVSLNVTAIKFASGEDFGDDKNYRLTGRQDYWIGKPDRVGRHSLANLVMAVASLEPKDLIGISIRDAAAHYLPNALVTFELKHRDAKIQGNVVKVQDITGLKPATAEEKASAV